jgi:hypothetical protein
VAGNRLETANKSCKVLNVGFTFESPRLGLKVWCHIDVIWNFLKYYQKIVLWFYEPGRHAHHLLVTFLIIKRKSGKKLYPQF